jgi:hypothetical protein
MSNQEIDERVLAEWRLRPAEAVCYYHFAENDTRPKLYRRAFYPPTLGAYVATWLGAPLGQITWARVWTNNFGARVVNVRVIASNRALYYGMASWDNGNVIRLRRMRGKRSK